MCNLLNRRNAYRIIMDIAAATGECSSASDGEKIPSFEAAAHQARVVPPLREKGPADDSSGRRRRAVSEMPNEIGEARKTSGIN